MRLGRIEYLGLGGGMSPLGYQPAGPERQADQPQRADQDPLERVDQAGIADLRQERRYLQEDDLHQQRAQRDTPVAADAAEDDGGEDRESLGVSPCGRRPGGEELDEQPAAETGDDAAD